MPTQLQKSPVGLLGAFALKIGGKNPGAFGDAVVPIADVYDQYLATSELQSNVTGGNAALAGSQVRTLTVPNGKAWRLMAFGMNIGLNAADVALSSMIHVAITSPLSGLPGAEVGSQVQAGGVSARAFAQTFRPPIFLPAGWGLNMSMVFSGPITVAVPLFSSALYQEFDQ